LLTCAAMKYTIMYKLPQVYFTKQIQTYTQPHTHTHVHVHTYYKNVRPLSYKAHTKYYYHPTLLTHVMLNALIIFVGYKYFGCCD